MSRDLISLFDYQARARQLLPEDVWTWIAGGATDGLTTTRNRETFERLSLRPRYLRDVSRRDLSTTVLGSPISLPVFLAPGGAHSAAHPDGELATVRGAGMSQTLMVSGTRSDHPLEAIASGALAPLWFQLYHYGYEVSRDLVCRAEAAGYSAICLSVDSILDVPKECDVRTGYQGSARGTGVGIANFRGMAARIPAIGDPNSPDWVLTKAPMLTWAELEWLRGLTSLPVVVKGLLTAEDARLAVEHGVNGIVVSNHGGRVVDSVPASIEVLPEIVEAVEGRAEIYLDSGVRRGSDVLKALGLGARAVAIGRPYYWGLAVNGAEGVHHVLEILRAELDAVMASCGQTSVRELEQGTVKAFDNGSSRIPCS